MEKKKQKIFKLVLYEEFTLDELLNLTMTRRRMFVYILGILFLIGFLIGLLFIYTPLSTLLPPVENVKLQNKVIQNTLLIDSLKIEMKKRDEYFEMIKKILTENAVLDYATIDSSQIKNLLTVRQKDSLFNILNEREKEIYAKNITDKINESIKLEAPLRGMITNEFDISNGHYGIDIVAAEGSPVLAIADGTVILATWSESMGYIVGVQHANNILSFYKHNSKLLVNEGDKVKSLDPIALVGNTGTKSTGPHLHFELWMNGQPVNPRNFIVLQ